MSYARWATSLEVAKNLEKIDIESGVKRSGIPIIHDKKYMYIDSHESHNMIIGSTGSGKTQAVILPLVNLSILSKESFVINDPKGEIYKKNASRLKKDGYNVIVIDFEDSRYGNGYNVLDLPYKLYKNNNKDKAIELIEDIGYYLFNDHKRKEIDPFWINSTINYFTGLVLYLFENANDDEINLKSVYNLNNKIMDMGASTFLSSLDNLSAIYINLSATLNSPDDTRGGIIATFLESIKSYITLDNLSNMLSYSDFDITNISNELTALFIVSGGNSYSNNLIPLLVNQIIESINIYGKQEKNMNILLDEFDGMVPIRNFYKVINYCRSIKVKITITIQGYVNLRNMYDDSEIEMLQMCFGNIIYLLSSDIYTLEKISKYCGNKNSKEPLITIEELKVLDKFEAIILMSRMMPYRGNLLPSYKIDWGIKDESIEIPTRENKNISIFK